VTWLLSRLFRVPALVVLVLLVLWLALTAATGSSVQFANAIATVVILLSPLALKHVKLDGPTMTAVAYLVAFLIAAVAGYASGEYHPDFSSVPALLASSTLLFGVQQLVFSLLKDNASIGPLLK